jgi:hypothetical protein
MKTAPGTQQGLLDRLLRLVVGAEHPVAVQMQGAQMRGYQGLERVTVARPGCGQKVTDIRRPVRAACVCCVALT